ncbi:MAG: hypothetical protein V1907_02055 [Candidatus Kerfeldbacteria bacterium]
MKSHKDQRGLGLVSTLLVLSLLAAFLAAVALVLSQERARVRDAHRVTDMVRVQFAFETLFREKASYKDAAAGCPTAGSLVSACSLSTYLPSIAQLKDPGKYTYRVTTVPDDSNYGVTFTLERGYDTLVKGKHIVSRDGIE